MAQQEGFLMDARHRGIQILGWLSAIVGYGLALLLIRGIFVGITRGFGARRSQAFWVVLGYLVFLAFAAYLISVGRRAISLAKGSPRPQARFGWGRIVIGAILVYSNVARHFHLIPARFKPLQPSNNVQALATNITETVILIGCVLLMLSGIWRGFRRPMQTNLGT
jgi:hypothetical protein